MGLKISAQKIKSQSGQAAVEMVLLLVLGTGIIFGLFKGLQSMDFVGKITNGPWEKVSGMVECGIWAPCGGNSRGKKEHPSNRVVSYRPAGQ